MIAKYKVSLDSLRCAINAFTPDCYRVCMTFFSQGLKFEAICQMMYVESTCYNATSNDFVENSQCKYAVKYKELVSAVNGCKSNDITMILDEDEETLTITDSRVHRIFKMILDSTDKLIGSYKKFSFDAEESLVLTYSEFEDIYKCGATCIDTNTRDNLQQVKLYKDHIEPGDTKLHCISTDSYMMQHIVVPEQINDGEYDELIEFDIIKHAIHILRKNRQHCSVCIETNEKFVRISTCVFVITRERLEYTFPESIRNKEPRVIHSQPSAQIVLNRGALIDALNVARTFEDVCFKGVFAYLNGNELSLSTKSCRVKDDEISFMYNVSEIKLHSREGNGQIEIGVNPKMLLKTLKSMKSAECTLSFYEPLQPYAVEDVECEIYNTLMPMIVSK